MKNRTYNNGLLLNLLLNRLCSNGSVFRVI